MNPPDVPREFERQRSLIPWAYHKDNLRHLPRFPLEEERDMKGLDL